MTLIDHNVESKAEAELELPELLVKQITVQLAFHELRS